MTVDLCCPREGLPLRRTTAGLECDGGHVYELRRGVPILLRDEVAPTQAGYWATGDAEWGLELVDRARASGEIHPYVREILVGTCGNLYRGVAVHDYPIPRLRLPPGEGRSFLELGANWGRWCVAASRLGYRAVGIDPALGAALVAAQVAEELGVEAEYLVADARHLPFAGESFDVVFSYSVLQHLPRDAVRQAIREATRVLRPGGTLLLQLPNAFGCWNVVRQARRRFRDAQGFDVRYWRPRELLAAAAGLDARLEADGFFTLNGQITDLPALPRGRRAVLAVSEGLRRSSTVARPLVYVADSLFVRARKAAA